MSRQRPTIADLLALKGKRQLGMLRITSLEEAEAAEKAGVDILSVAPSLLVPAFRDAAPTCFTIPGLDEYAGTVTTDDYLRVADVAMKAGADAVYCAASLTTIARLRAEGFPVCGHVGLIPARATWTGGFRAVGKTLETALLVWRQTQELEAAGAVMAEMEVVPHEVAAAISKRSSIFMLSMGSGTGCDAQYLFAEDALGINRGHYPRHAKKYRDFAAEHDRLQRERVAAFKEFIGDIKSGAYPEARHVVDIPASELAKFLAVLPPA
jgi:3-methyl-2-oxobutanoate hydroxymethyltransferase